jgi:hypothetical protein
MEVHGEGGALVSLFGGGGVTRSFLVILDMRWEMASILDFGMIYGVRIWPLRKPF